MGGSIHIHGTGSSILDTVFVCRTHGRMQRDGLFDSLDELSRIVQGELAQLRHAGVKPTAGDIRCIVFGHLTRIAIWRLRKDWDSNLPTTMRLERFATHISQFGDTRSFVDAILDGEKRPLAPCDDEAIHRRLPHDAVPL
jgi:hypothetical protein